MCSRSKPKMSHWIQAATFLMPVLFPGLRNMLHVSSAFRLDSSKSRPFVQIR
ncbi:hypothetical protein CCM_00233 [Cordyceps militaris CM01]|uniref:Uncharacterized protein n=1 Tax=Cordyceps militaris (strain CM01) TaxID=983644 RepID=G3J2Z6_CORMM|nr:uncharacterized protein CCM_00233 [Cordyceps militaris CM01]EGX95579.1 hypothetical protein CCM_00233 [Cordyceps militaris CM01]